jgi:hypothetical protein
MSTRPDWICSSYSATTLFKPKSLPQLDCKKWIIISYQVNFFV